MNLRDVSVFNYTMCNNKVFKPNSKLFNKVALVSFFFLTKKKNDQEFTNLQRRLSFSKTIICFFIFNNQKKYNKIFEIE